MCKICDNANRKFKVGDRVRRINSDNDLVNMTIGSEWVVCSVRNDGWMHVENYKNMVLKENFELIKEQSPIRQVTRREIIPGRYGRISVQNHTSKTINVGTTSPVGWSVSELREVSKLLALLADVLEENQK